MRVFWSFLGLITILLVASNTGLLMQEASASGGIYDWPMYGYDPACTGHSPSTAPNTNVTAWISDLPGGTIWAYPVVSGGKVFIGAGGYLNAFDENTGSFLWRYRAPDQPGYPATVAAVDGKVYFGTADPGPGGCMYALNTTTGKQIWNFTTGGHAHIPVVVEGRLYFGVRLESTGKIHCVNATTGASIWSYPTQDKMQNVAVAYGRVYATCGHWYTSTKGAIYCLDMYDGSFVWSFDTNRDLTSHLAVANGKVYVAASYEGWDHIIYALNATNGNVVWSTTRYSSGEGGNAAVAYGKVFIAIGGGDSGVYALNETDGDEIWAGPFGTVRGGPVVADSKVFLAIEDIFYGVNATTGASTWSYKTGHVHSRLSAIANERVFVATHYEKELYAFGEPYTGPQYTLSITTTTGGTTIPSPGDYNYTAGNSVQVTAIPDSGYQFDHWELDTIDVGSANPYTVLMDENHTLHAVFLPPPLSTSISPTTAKTKIGEPVSFTSTVSGGQSPYSYQWYLNGSAVSGATYSDWTFEPTATGHYIVHLNVTDDLGTTVKSNEATVTVKPQLTVSISPIADSILVGESVEFTSTNSGGYTPYSYQWYLNDAPVSGATSNTWTFTPTASGIYYVYLEVTDDIGNIAQSETARIEVAAVPVGGHSAPIQLPTTAKTATSYIVLLTILTTIFIELKRKTKKKH